MTKGKIFLVPFPYDDLSNSKIRPALCLINPIGTRRHVILAYISSNIPSTLLETDFVLESNHIDFTSSGLRVASVIRLHQLTTVSTLIIQRELGSLSSDTQAQIEEKLQKLLVNNG